MKPGCLAGFTARRSAATKTGKAAHRHRESGTAHSLCPLDIRQLPSALSYADNMVVRVLVEHASAGSVYNLHPDITELKTGHDQ